MYTSAIIAMPYKDKTRLSKDGKEAQARLREILTYNSHTGKFTRNDFASSPAGSNGTYRYIAVDGYLYKASRLAWVYTYGKWPDGVLDHIDRNTQNDRINNLRDVGRKSNQRNRGVNKNSKTGVRGVTVRKNTGKFSVRLRRPDGVHTTLGCYDTLEEAAKVAREHYEKWDKETMEEELAQAPFSNSRHATEEGRTY